MKKIKITALPILCADVFYGTDIVRAGGEALNFSAHASEYDYTDVILLGIIGGDSYGKAILASISKKDIDASHIRIDENAVTAHNITYLTPDGDRYYKPDSWHGEIFEDYSLSDSEKEIIADSDVVFANYYCPCFGEIVELKKSHDFLLAVDFDTERDFETLEKLCPFVDFFMISGNENILHVFRNFSAKYDGLFNVTLAEKGSVTYLHGKEYFVSAEKVSEIIDTTGCGDSYHAGFVCSYLADGDVIQAMKEGSHRAAKTLAKYGGF